MRFNSAYILAFAIISSPVFAQNNDAQSKNQIEAEKHSKSTNQTKDNEYQMALSCAASLQIAALAAPSWSNEKGVALSTNLWLAEVFKLADAKGVKGDKISETIKAEMEKQTQESVANPEALSKRAFYCAVNPPI